MWKIRQIGYNRAGIAQFLEFDHFQNWLLISVNLRHLQKLLLMALLISYAKCRWFWHSGYSKEARWIFFGVISFLPLFLRGRKRRVALSSPCPWYILRPQHIVVVVGLLHMWIVTTAGTDGQWVRPLLTREHYENAGLVSCPHYGCHILMTEVCVVSQTRQPWHL